MTARGPEHHEQVRVQAEDGRAVAEATCFYSTWRDEATGEPRWRGFLASIDPPGGVLSGRYVLEFPSGATRSVRVTEVRREPREQAMFVGESAPPS